MLDNDPAAHVVVMELLPDDAPNWQAEVAVGRTHAEVGPWAGETLGIWHTRTAGDPAVAEAFDDFESFEQQRLSPFYETVCERLPEAADDIVPRLEDLRGRRCFVDGDFAMKNMLVGPPSAAGSSTSRSCTTATRSSTSASSSRSSCSPRWRWPGRCADSMRALARWVPPRRTPPPPASGLAGETTDSDRAHRVPRARTHRRQVTGAVPRAAQA